MTNPSNSIASTKSGYNFRRLARNLLLRIYRLYFKRSCIGHQDRLEKAEYYTPDSPDRDKNNRESLDELRSLHEQLKNTTSKEDEYIKQKDSHSLTVSYQSPEIIEHHNVYFHPDYRCLFTEDGYRIKSSFAWSKRLSVPEKIEPPKECKIIEKPFLYIGAFETYQYGHFLVEGVSQLWALAENRDVPVFYANWMNSIKRIRMRRKKSYIDDFMSYLPISRDGLYYSDRLIKFNKIRIPQHTSVFGDKMFNHHRLVPEFVAKKILETNETTFSEYETIYLSRSKLKDGARSIINESDLEARLREKEVEIVYPESMTLSQQIILLNSSKNIIAVQGSALHSILFILTSGVDIYTIASEKTWLGTFYMIDKIKAPELTNTYVFTMRSDSGDDAAEWTQNKVIDVEGTMAQLSSKGLFD